MRGRTHFEDAKTGTRSLLRKFLIRQVNKARMIERMADAVKDKIIEGIADLRDESDRDGVRVVIELKRDAMPDVVLNQLFKYTPLQTSFGVNTLALDRGQPKMMSLLHIIKAFI